MEPIRAHERHYSLVWSDANEQLFTEVEVNGPGFAIHRAANAAR